MRTVHKYQLSDESGVNVINTHASARVVHVAMQHDVITAWVEIDTEDRPATMTLHVIGTGQSIPVPDVEHVGTAITASNNLVFHVYARPAEVA